MTTDVLDFVEATEGDRTMVRAALRGALLRHAAACRREAWEMTLDEDRAELLAEAHAAMIRALELEDA